TIDEAEIGSTWKASWLAVVLLLSLWLIPPMVYQALHLCPMRPDGARESGAVPSFARKYGVSCSQCHSEYPLLNDFGRQFKLNGYVMEKGGKEGVAESKDGL